MPQYFGAPNGSSRSRRRIVARSHPGDAGRPAELAVWATFVGVIRQAVMVLSTNGTGLSTALAVHGQVHVLGQLLGQVLHVHAGGWADSLGHFLGLADYGHPGVGDDESSRPVV